MSYPAMEVYKEEVRILGLRLSRAGIPEVHSFIERAIRENKKALVLNLNIHCVNLAHQEPWLRDFINQAALIFCDGDGVRWGLRCLGIQPPPKITYAAWIDPLAEFCQAKGFSLYFLGSKPGIAEEAARKLSEKYPTLRILGTGHGYFQKEGPENDKITAEINRLKPDILITGFGMPLQEKWLRQNWEKLDCHVFLNGGAVFDYVSSRVKRAPGWMLGLHLEWFFRLCQEPRRLFGRYVIGNPLFMLRIFREKFRKK